MQRNRLGLQYASFSVVFVIRISGKMWMVRGRIITEDGLSFRTVIKRRQEAPLGKMLTTVAGAWCFSFLGNLLVLALQTTPQG